MKTEGEMNGNGTETAVADEAKAPNQMTLAECVTELTAALESGNPLAPSKMPKRIDHARQAVTNLRGGQPASKSRAGTSRARTATREKATTTTTKPVAEGDQESSEISVQTAGKKTAKKPAKKAPKKAASKVNGGNGSSIVPAHYRADYIRDKEHKTAGGAASIHNGDSVAKALLGSTPDDLAKFAKENGVLDRFKGWSESLNPGQVRMNLGNVLRAMARKDGVTINGKRVRIASEK